MSVRLQNWWYENIIFVYVSSQTKSLYIFPSSPCGKDTISLYKPIQMKSHYQLELLAHPHYSWRKAKNITTNHPKDKYGDPTTNFYNHSSSSLNRIGDNDEESWTLMILERSDIDIEVEL